MNKIINYFHHFFVPKEDNNFRAKALHTNFLTYYLVLALFLTFTFKYINQHFNSVLGFATDITVEKLYQLTNQEREKQGLTDLGYNEKLAQAAAKKAQDMFANNYWAHYGPGGTTPWDFILAVDYHYEFAGENLAKNFLFSQGVVDAWMASKTHRENLLRKEYSDVGFAIVNGVLNGEETTLVVQMFGKPIGSAISAKPVEAKEPEQPAIKAAAPRQQAVVYAKKTTAKPISLINLSFNFNLIFMAFLILALVMDFYFAAKFKIVRIGGKNIAHFIFIGFIIIGIFIFARGAIL